jgi:glycerophosphoryl diester phosphodiesterase
VEALDAGADGIEFDVRLSADGVPIVIHDATLDRTTRLRGRVADALSSEMRDAGVPTLAETIALRQESRPTLLLELKTEPRTRGELVAAAVRAIAETGVRDRAIVLSFDHAALAAVKALDAAIRTAASIVPSVRAPRPSAERLIDMARRASADALALHYTIATRRRIATLADAGLDVHAWTVNSVRTAGRLTTFGARTIISDTPRALVRALSPVTT